MKTLIRNGTVMLLAISTTSYAANGGEAGGGSLLMWIFFSFVAFIVVMQLIPGLTLFIGMLKGIFSTVSEKEELTAKAKSSE